MKHFTLILFCFLLLPSLLPSQIEKGSISFGGNIQAQQTWAESNQYSGFSWTINPSVAFMINDNWLVGGTVGAVVYDNLGESDNSILQPEVRYYFNPAREKNKYFAGFAPSINLGNFDNSLYNFTLGFSRFLNSNVALEATSNYQLIGQEDDIFTINLGLRSFMDRPDRDNWKTATSAFEEGDLLIGTGIAQVSYFSDFMQLILSPRLGSFISDQLMLGAQLSSSIGFRTSGTRNLNTSSFALYPFARYYLSGQKHWRWFAEAGFTYAANKATIKNNFESNSSVFYANTKWGTNLFLTSNLAFEFSLDAIYNFGTNSKTIFQDFGGNPNPNNFDGLLPDSGFSLATSISVQYFLNREK